MLKRQISKAIVISIGALFALSLLIGVIYMNVTDPQLFNQRFLSDQKSGELEQQFLDFILKYQKVYSQKSDMAERFKIFQQNYISIQTNNQLNKYKQSVNQFSDLTIQEFESIYGINGIKLPQTLPIRHRRQEKSTINLKENVNWFKAGKVSPAQNQKNCGSCWAFTTATALESLNAIQNNLDKVPVYSIQYLMDCDPINIGCGGGWMMDAYDYTRMNGIVSEGDYPYKYISRQNYQCYDTSTKEKFHNKDAIEEDSISNERLKEILMNQPAGVAMHSNQGCLMSYSSGIIKESDCPCSNPNKKMVNHAVTLVGYGKSDQGKGDRDDCNDYWVVKNSWGPDWGEEGHFRLCMDDEGHTPVGICQVNSYVQYPTL